MEYSVWKNLLCLQSTGGAANGHCVAHAILDFYKSFGFTNCKKTLEVNGFDDDIDQFTENLIPAILDDFKSRNWVPPIDGEENRENLVKICHMIYNEK